MKLAKVKLSDGSRRAAIVEDKAVQLLDFTQLENIRSLADILHSKEPAALAKFLVDQNAKPVPIGDVTFLSPIDRQEVWAAGVTYKRSQVARMEESKSGASHYDKVYSAPRPELFFKGTPNRVSGPGEPVRVRVDSKWSVPEPEFTLVLNPDMKIVGYTIGNDMSARDIEGENPLYLPQAKVYKQCCALGPAILLATEPLDKAAMKIDLSITRGGKEVFRGSTSLAQLNRELPDIAGWLAKENEFPTGCFLLTGTGIVPPDDFTLENGDGVAITIAGIGTLTNPVVKDAS
jgi:2-dehydro-3-deoxy-D-arabinonate dehydratase